MGADIDLHDMENEFQELLHHSITDYSKIARIERAKLCIVQQPNLTGFQSSSQARLVYCIS